MADVKWIKIVTDIFDDEKMLLIESLPSADSLIVIWFKLLCLAGKNNNDGVFLMNDRIAYTEEMLSTIFRRDINTVRLALDTFERFGMIEIINGVITIPNWGKHQTLDSYEKKKERDRIYQAERRAKQKEIADKSSDKSSDVAISDKDIEEDKERDKEKNIKDSCSEQAAEPPFITLPLNDKSEYPVTNQSVREYKELYPAVNVEQELRNMRGWCLSNPTKRKTKSGIGRFINSWLSKEQNKGNRNNSSFELKV